MNEEICKKISENQQAIETLINEYSNLRQIEEAHRIENGKMRERIKELEEKKLQNSIILN